MNDKSNHSSDLILERLMQLHPKLIDLSLDRIKALLARLDKPHTALPPVIHVAGTNGKGSVIAYLRAAFEASGKKVHVYTSPHLIRFHERIRLGSPEGGQLIAEAALLTLLEECEAANQGQEITYFEITTAAAFLAFARHPADLLLLEVGLGGRLDATNVIINPELSIIMPVSYDHQHFLGDSLTEIATEKAGILKSGTRAVIAQQPEEVLTAIRIQAKKLRVALHEQGVHWHITPQYDGFLFADSEGEQTFPLPALPGAHQIANAGAAIAALRILARQDPTRFALPLKSQAAGVTTAFWPGRLQLLKSGILVDLLPFGWSLWLDGGHNPAAGLVLAEMAQNWSDQALHLIIGMMANKASRDFIAPLRPLAASIQAVDLPEGANGFTATELAALLDVRAAASPVAAIRHIIASDQSGGPCRILICGSLYLAGHVLDSNESVR